MKNYREKYVTCPICGASLDFGEKCDCEEKAAEIKADTSQKGDNYETYM